MLSKKEKNRRKKERESKTKWHAEKKLKSLHRLAWKLQLKYLRNKAEKVDGKIECFTCRGWFEEKKTVQSHYWHGVLDFDYYNIHLSCTRCNRHLRGNLPRYTIRIIYEYGVQELLDLERRATNFTGYTVEQLNFIIDGYKKAAV